MAHLVATLDFFWYAVKLLATSNNWRCVMLEDRQHARSSCEEQCLLHLRGWYYPATFRNLSLGGALVRPVSPLTGLHAGESCNVFMHDDFLCEYYCKIVRVYGNDLALKIIDGYSESPFAPILMKLYCSCTALKRSGRSKIFYA